MSYPLKCTITASPVLPYTWKDRLRPSSPQYVPIDPLFRLLIGSVRTLSFMQWAGMIGQSVSHALTIYSRQVSSIKFKYPHTGVLCVYVIDCYIPVPPHLISNQPCSQGTSKYTGCTRIEYPGCGNITHTLPSLLDQNMLLVTDK